MSIEAVQKVFDLNLPSTAKHVLTILAFRANDEGECWPSYESLAHDTGLGDRSIIRAVNLLIEQGYLIRTKKGGGKTKSSHYLLALESGDSQSGDLESGDLKSGDLKSGGGEVPGDSQSPNQVTQSQVEGGCIYNMKKRKKDTKRQERHSLSSNDTAPPHDTSATSSNSHEDALNPNESQTDGQTLTKKEKGRKKGIYSKDFEKFWMAYPRKVGKGDAWKAWQACIDRPSVDDLIERVRRVADTPQWTKENGQYIPHPSTWIRQRRFEDEACLPKPKKRFVSAFDRDYGEWQAEMLQLLSLRDDTMSMDQTVRIAAVIEIDSLEEDLRKRGCPYV